MSVLLTEEYLEERARRAGPTAVDRILMQVPDVPPIPGEVHIRVSRIIGLHSAHPTYFLLPRRSVTELLDFILHGQYSSPRNG